MFSRFVYHITGVAVMVLAISAFQGTHSKPDSKIDMGKNPIYLPTSMINCENDMQTIDVGYIGDDIIALCTDDTYKYAMIATKQDEFYLVQMSSTHGIITTSKYPVGTGSQQIVHLAMVNHLQAIQKIEEDAADQARETTKSLN